MIEMQYKIRELFVLVLIFLLSFSLSACGNNNKKDDSTPETPEISEELGKEQSMKLVINGKEFITELQDNATTKALLAILPMTITMNDMPHEKYYYLPNNLPTSPVNPKTIQAGDIMLWGSNCLVLFYESFSTTYSYTKIGHINNTTGLAATVGSGNVIVTFQKSDI